MAERALDISIVSLYADCFINAFSNQNNEESIFEFLL